MNVDEHAPARVKLRLMQTRRGLAAILVARLYYWWEKLLIPIT